MKNASFNLVFIFNNHTKTSEWGYNQFSCVNFLEIFMTRKLSTGPDTLLNAAALIKRKVDALRKSRVADAVENVIDPVDTPFEVEVFTAGKLGPIDTPIEVERYLSTNSGFIERSKSAEKNNEDMPHDIPTPNPSALRPKAC